MQRPYELQEAAFVAGTYKKFEIYPKNEYGEAISLLGTKVKFSVMDYINPGTVLVSKAGNAAATVVTAELTSAESAKLHGKYIYQFTVVDPTGPAYCARGLMNVWANVDPAALTE